MTDIQPRGLSRGLTNYGDADFSLYLRRSFASSMGYSREMLDRQIVGICHSASGFNNCHRHVPEMIEAVKHFAGQEGITVSSWIRRLVGRELQRLQPSQTAPMIDATVITLSYTQPDYAPPSGTASVLVAS